MSSIEYLALYLCRYNLASILPILMVFFKITYGSAGALASAGFIAYAIMLFPAGLLGDSLGSKKVVVLGATISSLSNLAFPLAQDFHIALIIQFLNGLGQGMVWGPLTRLVSDYYSEREVGLAVSMLLLSANSGPILAYILSSYLTANYSWSTVFSYPSLILLAVTVLFWLLVKSSSTKHSSSFLLIKERISLILTNKSIWLIAFSYACYMCISRTLLAWLPTYLTEKVNIPICHASILGSLAMLAGTVTPFIGVWLTNTKFRGKSKFVIALSFILSAPVLYIITITTEGEIVLIMLASLFALLGLGGSLYFTYTPVFISKDVVGTASGFIDGIAYIGSFLGVFMVGILYDIFLSYIPALTLLIIVALIGAIIALLISS